MSGFIGDLRAAARRLLAAPIFTLFAVLSLAVGVGVTTAAYSVVDGLFLRDLGIPDPERLVFVVTPFGGRMLTGTVSEPDFRDLRKEQQSFSVMSASASFTPSVTSKSTTAIVAGEAVDGAYFSTLNIGAAIGRTIQAADDQSGAQVVMVSHRMWRSRFGSDPRIVGQTIRVAGRPFEIVGVAPEKFGSLRGWLFGTDVWIPRGAERSAPAGRDVRNLVVFARLAASATAPAASLDLKRIAAGLDAAFPPFGDATPTRGRERQWSARSAADLNRDDRFVRRLGMTLLGLVALVLVVACTNLANLVMARGTSRQQEIAVRYALGAPRWRLVRAQCAESLLLAIAGAVGANLVFALVQFMTRTEFNVGAFNNQAPMAISIDPHLNAGALIAAAASLLLSLLVFGLEPALQLTRNSDIRGELTVESAPRSRRQRFLLRWQVLTATGFFIVATMFVKFSIQEIRHDSGVDMDRLGVATVNFAIQEWDEVRVRRTLERVVDVAQKQPGVEAAAVSTTLPFGVRYAGRPSLYAPGQPSPGFVGQRGMVIGSSPSIFRVLGIEIVRGRGFDDRDNAAGIPVTVVSEIAARQVFGTIDAVGREIVIETSPTARTLATVVGVARDTDTRSILGDPHAVAWVPFAQHYDSSIAITVRASGDTAAAVGALREALRSADPDLAVSVIGRGRSVLAGPLEFVRGLGLTTLGLGVLTLLLAMAGLFGIQMHLVARRTREIGVRMSFGATSTQIRRMVLKDGSRPVIEGMLLGLTAGLLGRAFIVGYLEIDVAVIDLWSLVIVPVPLILAGYGACYLPARRAAGVDPNVALRHL